MLLPVFGCLWDSDTVRDEIKLRPSLYDLISGQIPKHGQAYYEKRKALLEGRDWEKEPLSLNEKIDLGVTYTRLKKYDSAEKLFLKLLEQYPDKYELNSNIGVLYKKTGDYEQSYSFLERALEIKPEGHMGLGDWYLKRVKYELIKTEGVEYQNFLGEKSKAMYLGSNRKLSPEQAQRINLIGYMVINDRYFADTYVLLGDVLRDIGDLNFAARSYAKAIHLDHPLKDLVSVKLDIIIQHWGNSRGNARGRDAKADRERYLAQYQEEFKKADRWIEEFWKVEADLVNKGYFPSLEETEQKMTYKRYYPKK